jgi:Flp pilus assembly protein TadD
MAGALADSQTVIDNYPASEHPWELRATMAERLGRPDLAASALTASTERWPSNAVSWYKLGLLLEQRDESERARRAIERARLLQPSLDLPGAGPISVR